ncbi:hypothetical protein LIS04_107 [Listeria phage LIS04]|nr:hypothetical protein LIS04_107 [Listeria phage LIS04]
MEVYIMFDLSNVLNTAQQIKSEKDNSNDGRMKLIYPDAGTLKVKLLFNPASSTAIRKVRRHKVNGVQVPCLQMYGQTCEVCKVVDNIETIKGADLWKFKPKDRGILFAQYIGDDYNRGQNDKAPAEGEIIRVMVPWVVYRDLNAIIAEAGPEAQTIMASNKGKIVKIMRAQVNNRTEYRVELDAFSEYTSCGTDEEFVKLLNELPTLNEELCPPAPTETIVNQVKEISAKLSESYLSDSVLGNPQSNGTATNLGNVGGQAQGGVPEWAQNFNAPQGGMPNTGVQQNYGQSPNMNYGQGQQGGFNQQTGGFNPQTGGFNQQTGGFNQQTGGFNQQTGGFNPSQQQQSSSYGQSDPGVQNPQGNPGQVGSTGGAQQQGGGNSNNPWANSDVGSDDGVSPS